MAVVFACSENSGLVSVSAEYASYMGPGQRVGTAVNTTTRANFDSSLSEGRVTFYYRHGTWSNTGAEMTVFDSSGLGIVRMWKSSTTAVRFEYWNGTAWVIMVTQAAPNSTQKYEFSFTTGIGGQFTFYYNNALVGSYDIGDAHAPAAYLTAYAAGGTGTAEHRGSFSSILVTDNARNLLNTTFETKGPTSNGTDATDGVGSYTDVDESVSDLGSTALQLVATTHKRSFKGSARTLTYAGGVILAVTVAAEMRIGDTGPTKARLYLVIGGTRYYGRTHQITETYQGYHHAFNLNPATGLKWTYAEAESALLEWGVEAVD